VEGPALAENTGVRGGRSGGLTYSTVSELRRLDDGKSPRGVLDHSVARIEG